MGMTSTPMIQVFDKGEGTPHDIVSRRIPREFRIGQTFKYAVIRIKVLLVKTFIFNDGLRDGYSL